MFSFDRLWQTMEKKGYKKSDLEYKFGFNRNTVQRIREGKNVTLLTVEKICAVLNCKIEDVVEFIKEDTPTE